MAKKDNDQMQISDFNLEKITTAELENVIQAGIQAKTNIGIFGRRGSGKTEISKQVIKRTGLNELYLNLSMMDKSDLAGLPQLFDRDRNNRYINYLLPYYFRSLVDGEKRVVVLMDEVDKAAPELHAPLLEFTQFHSVNGTALPNLESVIMTGNLIAEGGARPSLPLLDRAEKYLVEANLEAWFNWAGKSGEIHPSIIAYLNDHPQDLFGAVDVQDNYADPSPRGWHNASKLLKIGEDKGWPTELLHKKVAGCVGKKAGLDYSNYYTHYRVLLPLVDLIFAGKDVNKKYDKLSPSEKLILCLIVCTRFATQLDEAGKEGKFTAKNPPDCVKNVGKFMQHVSLEHVLITVRSQVQLTRIVKWNLDDHAEWSEVLNKINASVSG